METKESDPSTPVVMFIAAFCAVLMMIPIGIILAVTRCASLLTSRSKHTQP